MSGQQLSTIIQNCRRKKRGQQLSTITNNCDDHGWSTIINNYLKLQKEKEVNNYQPLPTIAMIMGGNHFSHNITDAIILTPKKFKKNSHCNVLFINSIQM